MDFDTIYCLAKDLPIIDWHNHLDMRMLAEDKPLGSLYDVWVKADPYKHRAMRICGEPERLITGDASEAEKWSAWTRTLPKLVGNPLFAWARMEMDWLGIGFNTEAQRHRGGMAFGDLENVSLSEWTPSKLLSRFKVEYMSPCMAAGATFDGRLPTTSCRIVPSLRMNAGEEVTEETLARFHAAGCRVVDISVDDAAQLETCYDSLASVASFAAVHGWTMLLHLGALRETSARLRTAAGPAGGYAGMRAPVDPSAVAAFLNRLESTPNIFSHKDHKEHKDELFTNDNCHNCSQITNTISSCSTCSTRLNASLPRTILMTLNPEAHAQLAVLAGSFVEEGVPGKVQLGPAWWWCDHAEGIRDVFEKQAAYGVLSTFVGMTTDSRSLLSFVRHDYFRRLFCRWLADKVAAGDFPDDRSLLLPLVEKVCYANAKGMLK